MAEKIGVLVFPAGEVNSIELHDALSSCVNIHLVGASSIERHGKYIFKNYIDGLPLISDSTFINRLNAIIDEHKIHVIFPTHDTVAQYLMQNQDAIRAKIVSGDKQTSEICRDKEKIYSLFEDCTFSPKIYRKLSDAADFPLFSKPKIGQGSVGVKKIHDKKDLDTISFADSVITEYLPGEEYTVDCLTDKKGELKHVSPRSRNRILAGICVAGAKETLTDEIKEIAQVINNRLKFSGLWFFQIKKDKNGKFKLLEISTRCAGAMCLSRGSGVNLPLLSVYVALGYDITIVQNSYNIQMDRTLISRYNIDYDFDIVYIDYDDTIIFDGKVNLNVIRFLYQCCNFNKKIILISKHDGNLYENLNKYHIAKELFTDIIHLKPDERKVDYIQPKKTIFIDNSFNERKEVSEIHKIPVFDNDTIEVLLDWRS
jgi:hypothetical protein